MPFGNSGRRETRAERPQHRRQSQRDCVFQPRVARNELPWVPGPIVFNPNGVASGFKRSTATPLGLFVLRPVPQGSSFLATLGFGPESFWDSPPQFPKDILLSPGDCLARLNTLRIFCGNVASRAGGSTREIRCARKITPEQPGGQILPLIASGDEPGLFERGSGSRGY